MDQARPLNHDFWRGRRVLLTGHTGFKGAWAAAMLRRLGASVTGVALAPEGDLNLWRLIGNQVRTEERLCDLRDAAALTAVCRDADATVVLHMAAQAQVRRSYDNPAETFATNVSGTVHLLDALRALPRIEAVLVVTSDKVYRNHPGSTAFREDDELGGSDPYSASKAAAELVVRSYEESYFAPRGVPLATARGGNVLGGGDFASDRLVPDVFRAARAGKPLQLRHPQARRPWQHVLDCVAGYLRFLEHLHGQTRAHPPTLNFGPIDRSTVNVSQIAEKIGRRLGNPQPWQSASDPSRPEHESIELDCSLAQQALKWSGRLDVDDTLEWTADWYARFANREDAWALVSGQIERYLNLDR